MLFKSLLPAMLLLLIATTTLASPVCCDKHRKETLKPFTLPHECGDDAWWDSDKVECICKGRGAVWNAKKRKCRCLNDDTEWHDGKKTCMCRSLQKEINSKGECVCITSPFSLWFQDLGRLNDCPKPELDPNAYYGGIWGIEDGGVTGSIRRKQEAQKARNGDKPSN